MKSLWVHLSAGRRRGLVAFVFGAVLIALGSISFIGIAKRWFVDYMPLQFYADSALQLHEGLPIRLAGIRIGEVSHLSLDESGKVLVKIRVERRYSPFLRGTTEASLAKETLMGDSFIDLSAGDRLTPPLADGATIPYLPATDINTAARLMAVKLDQTLTELQKLLVSLNDPGGNLQGSLKNLDGMMREMRTTRVKLDETLTNVNKVAQETDMRKTLDDANRMINNANETIENMQQRWPFSPTDDLKKERGKTKPAAQ